MPTGNKLTYSIANRPAWASFSTTTGELCGTPFAEHAKVYSGIVISVTDGTTKVSLPACSLTVKPNANKSPVITGTPVDDGEGRHGVFVPADGEGSGRQGAHVLDPQQADVGDVQHLDRQALRHADGGGHVRLRS